MNAEVDDEEYESDDDTKDEDTADEDEGDENQAIRLWSSKEDKELVKQVRKHGTSWATILNESSILRKRYADSASGKCHRLLN